MTYDVIIRGGTVVDGSGLPPMEADVAIADGRIAAIGKLNGSAARETIDARGHVVSPGFIDGHTHMDAQVFWDHIGSNTCWNGVTSVVMGNCGFTLAPCAERDMDLVLHNFERAEDIPREAMKAGIPWSWETFSEFYAAIDALPKGLNYASFVGHSALRTHVMGKRAMVDRASPVDLRKMQHHLEDAMRAGALGFSTSRTSSHRTPEGKPVASRLANFDELLALSKLLVRLGAGIVQIARENVIVDPAARKQEYEEVKKIAIDLGLPVTFGNTWHRNSHPELWRSQVQMVDEIIAAGGRAMMQGTASWNGSLRSFETMTPFDHLPAWKSIRSLPLAEQEAALRDTEARIKLVDAVHAHRHSPDPTLPNAFQRPVDWAWVFPLDRPLPPYRSIAEIAASRGVDPVDAFIDLALDHHLKLFFIQPSFNQDQDAVLAMMRHPHTCVTFSDVGAHVATSINPIHGHLLGHWVRNENALPIESAIRKITLDIANFWGLRGRGWLHEGYHADVTVFNPETVAPGMPELVYDLPAGAPRIKQKTDGIAATIVNGQVFMRNNEHTGAYPGRLLRGPLAHN